MTMPEARNALRTAIRARGGACRQWEVLREIGEIHKIILARPHKPLELWDANEYALAHVVKERRLKKLRSRNGRCLTCNILIMDCRCLATIAEYESIEAGSIHITRNRLDAAMDRALDRDVEIWHRAIDDEFRRMLLEDEERRANDPDAYYGEF